MDVYCTRILDKNVHDRSKRNICKINYEIYYYLFKTEKLKMKILFLYPFENFPIQPVFFSILNSQFDSNNIRVQIMFKSIFKLHSFLGR